MRLEDNDIDVQEAGVTAKLYESVMSSLKTQIEYNKMLGNPSVIPFLEGEPIRTVNAKKLLEQKHE
jgi:hypothetical protein